MNNYFNFNEKYSEEQIIEYLFKKGYTIQKIKVEYSESVYHNSFEDKEIEIKIPVDNNGKYTYCEYGEIKKRSYEELNSDYLKRDTAVKNLFEYLFTQQLYNLLLKS